MATEQDSGQTNPTTMLLPSSPNMSKPDKLSLPLLSNKQIWDRPTLTEFSSQTDSNLCFQLLEADEGILNIRNATVRLFGVTEQGNSILLHVTGFKHFLYINAPASFQQSDCAGYKDFLEDQTNQYRPVIDSVTLVPKQNIYGYQGNVESNYIKVTGREPMGVSMLRHEIEEGGPNWKGMWEGIRTYDNMSYSMRFMVDTKIQGMSWVEAPASFFKLISEENKQSSCQIEAEVHYLDLIAHQPIGRWAKMAPLIILSFHIQCAGRKGIFPDPSQDSLVQITNVVTRYGNKEPFIRNVFCFKPTNGIVGSQILEFGNEIEMLSEWRNFLLTLDPDIIIGYNICDFDFPYLLDRAKHLDVAGFHSWSRITNELSVPMTSSFSSKNTGRRDANTVKISGRLQLDLLRLIQRDHGLSSYTLNSTSAHFLGEQTQDIDPSMVTELFNGTSENRRRLALYGLKHASVLQKLMDQLSALENCTELARVSGVQFNQVLSQSPQMRFKSQLFRKALEQNLVVPELYSIAFGNGNTRPIEVEGALPVRGYYDVPIVALDFTSLYPSIIQNYNLCYTTTVDKETIRRFNLTKDEDYFVTPSGDSFLSKKLRKGLLGELLDQLFTAHDEAKHELALESDPLRKVILNGRHLALKSSINNIYRWTAATTGRLHCIEIARSIRSFAKQTIDMAKSEVETIYTIAHGYSHDAQVIYSDKDAMMVRFGAQKVEEVMRLAEEAANVLSSKLILTTYKHISTKPFRVNLNQGYFLYLLMDKKRYAGLSWKQPYDKYNKIDRKCIGAIHRGNCLLVRTVIEKVLDMILIHRDITGAQEYVRNVITDLLENKIDISQLIMTRLLTEEDSHTNQRPHAALARRNKARDAALVQTYGDQIAYVMIYGTPGDASPKRMEDPIYALENNMRINTKYYIEKQPRKPLTRIFEPIIGEYKTELLLANDYVPKISLATPKIGSIIRFSKITQRCLGCKKPLLSEEESGKAICFNCLPQAGKLQTIRVNEKNDLETRLDALWKQCHQCQGDMEEVVCNSRDCPTIFKRTKFKKELDDVREKLSRFDVNQAINW